jgi:hypothetical protein
MFVKSSVRIQCNIVVSALGQLTSGILFTLGIAWGSGSPECQDFVLGQGEKLVKDGRDLKKAPFYQY